MEEKEIRKDSFSYKVAYGFGNRSPRRENHCRFWQRFLLMFFIGWPVGILVLGIATAVMFLITLPFAARPGIFEADSRNLFVSYKKWPKIKGYFLRPIYLLLPLALYYLRSFFLAIFTFMSTNIGLSIIGICLVVIGLIFALKLFSKTESYQLTRDYLKAKKQGICPMITFVDAPTETAAE